MDKNQTFKVKFRMLHITGEWFKFEEELKGDFEDVEEEIVKAFAAGHNGLFNVGLTAFKGEHWSCLTFDGV